MPVRRQAVQPGTGTWRGAAATPGLRSASSSRDTAPATGREGRIVGRDAEVGQLVSLLTDADRAGVVVLGEPGIGRTRLLDAVEARLHEAGLPVHRPPVTRSGTPGPVLSVATGVQRPIVILDDAHLLGEHAASHLHDLAVTGRVRLLLTLPTGLRQPEAVVALWKDGACERFVLGPLTREACDVLVAGVTEVAGTPVDAATSHLIWTLTGGRPRLVVHLVRGLVDSGMLVREGEGECEGRGEGEVWTWDRPGLLPEGLVDLVVGILGELPQAQQDALDLVACSGPVGPGILTDAGARPEALERLERTGVVTTRRSGRRLAVEIPDPLLAMAVRQGLGRLRRRHLRLRLARAWESRGHKRRGDVARSAGLLLDGGGTPTPEFARKGAREAMAQGEYRLAERLARSAIQSGAGASAVAHLAEALSSQGRAQEAESALLEAVTGADNPALQLVRAANLRWGLSDRETAHSLVEQVLGTSSAPRVRAAARLSLAGFHLHDGHFREALALAEKVLDEQPPGTRARYQALAVSISALTSLGRVREAVERAGPAVGALAAHPGEQPAGLFEVNQHQLAASVARAHLVHGDLDAVERLARERYERAGGRRLLVTATWASMLGEVALLRGRVRTAIRLLDEANAAARRSGVGGLVGTTVRVMAAKNLARALVTSGQPDAALRAVRSIAEDDLRSLVAIDLWTGDVNGALVAATSRADRGVELALSAAARLRPLTGWGLYVSALHQVVRLGGAAKVPSDALAGVTVQGPLLQVQACHVQAAMTGDAVALEDVAQRYVTMGTHLFAAEAAAEAARVHDAAGGEPAARRATALAQTCMERCEGASTPGTAMLREPAVLTRRQREIARLAARGMPSKEIAQRLVLSVRTVDNCLGQTYRRLGISNRHELAYAMGLPLDRPAAARRVLPRPPAAPFGEVE